MIKGLCFDTFYFSWRKKKRSFLIVSKKKKNELRFFFFFFLLFKKNIFFLFNFIADFFSLCRLSRVLMTTDIHLNIVDF